MVSELPAGWRTSALADLVETVRGVTYNKSQARDSGGEGLMPILRANNIKSGILRFDDLVFVPEECVSSAQTLSQGDIVVAMSSGSRSVVGKSAQLTAPWRGSFGAFCGVLRTATDMDARYLYYFTQSRAYRDCVSELAAGVNINNLKPAHFENIPAPVAPLREQRKIAQKLDALLAQVDTLKARIDAIPALLKRFRQAILSSAVSGHLTEDWRSQSQRQKSQSDRSVRSLSELSELITSGSRGWADYYSEKGAIFIRSQDINTDELDLTNTAFVNLPESSEGKRTRVKTQDILVTITGANVGKVARIRENIPEAYVSQHVALIRLNDPTLATFIELYLKDIGSGRGSLQQLAYGGGKPGLNLTNLKELSISLFSCEERIEIVRRVEQLFALADQLEAKVSTAQKRIDTLTQSLLAKAFRGELVPQDPDDEPASVLLERIRAQRAAAPKPKRGRKTAAP